MTFSERFNTTANKRLANKHRQTRLLDTDLANACFLDQARTHEHDTTEPELKHTRLYHVVL